MRPTSMAYSEEVKKWLREHPGRVVTANDIPQIYNASFKSAANPETIKNEFKKTGMWPFNRSVYGDDDFVASGVMSPKNSSSVSTTTNTTTTTTDDDDDDDDDDGGGDNSTNLNSNDDLENGEDINDANVDDGDAYVDDMMLIMMGQSNSQIQAHHGEIESEEEIVAHSSKTTADEYKRQFFREALTVDTSSSDVEPEKKRKIDSFNISPQSILPFTEHQTSKRRTRQNKTAILTSCNY
ncbi:hypothetical protein KQX54_010034 [Cotesia glomerata]|uniref:Uncharacterized protein n=1 Tax=Cotesia glomerata TaxID=32391 RepID=A0AAV7I292_COTGL|nr:hypothetical protein KQX54_010034 [Cotesia glomerata]